jgi:hypothetical protein
VAQIMDRRKALAVTIVAGPTTTAVFTLGALVSPAAAEGGHGSHRRGASHSDVATNPRTITCTGSSRARRHRRACRSSAPGASTTTILLTVNYPHPNPAPSFPLGTNPSVPFNGSRAFVDPGKPSATIADIAHGDRLIGVWKAAPGTPGGQSPGCESRHRPRPPVGGGPGT